MSWGRRAQARTDRTRSRAAARRSCFLTPVLLLAATPVPWLPRAEGSICDPEGPATVESATAAVTRDVDQLAPVQALDGVVWTDVDEAQDQFVVGVTHERHCEAVRGAVAELGLPQSAVRIELTGPVVRVDTGGERPVRVAAMAGLTLAAAGAALVMWRRRRARPSMASD